MVVFDLDEVGILLICTHINHFKDKLQDLMNGSSLPKIVDETIPMLIGSDIWTVFS